MTPATGKKAGISDKLLAINSNWTAQPAQAGWRHYRISGRRYAEGELWLEMMSVCDRGVRVWVAAQELKVGDKWKSGWD